MARARYLIQWFPPIIEEELSEVTLKQMMSQYDQEQLRIELGVSMFGDIFKPHSDNAELPSIMAGQLGSKVKEYKNVLEKKIVIKKEET